MSKTNSYQTAGNSAMQRVFMVMGIVGVIATIIAGIFVYRAAHDQQKMMQSLNQQIAAMAQQNKVPTAEELQGVVAAAINNIAREEQEKMVQAKRTAYSNAAPTVPDDKHIYGNLNARFTLVEFSDLECPYCKRFHSTPKKLVDESQGNVNWQWMHMPLGFHNPAAQYGAEAAECAAELGDNRSFWMYIDEFFAHTRGGGQGVNDLAQLATNIGLDADEFRECMQSARHRDKVQEHVNAAQNLGITGTPATFLVDNVTGESQLLGGAQPAEAFIAAMRKMMAESNENNTTDGS